MIFGMDKVGDLIQNSKVFRVMFFSAITLLLLLCGLFQLSDYLNGEKVNFMRSFPVTLGGAGLALYLTICAYRQPINEK